RAQVASVPVFQYGGAGFVMSFPVATGDTGWIKANDRDISLFKQTMQANPPNTQRKHSFEDAMFFPDTLLDGVTIAAEDVGNAVFQNGDGTVRLALWPTLFKFTAPQVTVGDIEGYTPTPNAVLDVQSTTKAFIPPRMTTGQRDAIPDPVEGMTIYNLTSHALETYTNAGWP
ncbi:Gp138 family membrane-puncturing spike protein, partial [Singulisphaera rosea]